MKHACLLITVALFTASCTSVGYAKKDYQSKLSNIELGMAKKDFLEVFPDSIMRGAKQYPNGKIEVLEVSYKYYSFLPTGNKNRNEWSGMEGQPQWFYFYNGKLLQYGNPEDWPANPDLIIEKRER